MGGQKNGEGEKDACPDEGMFSLEGANLLVAS
jgi:hypothetical protein